MSNYRNAQLMVGDESTAGTPVTPDRWLPYTGDPGLNSAYGEIDGEAVLPGEVITEDEAMIRVTEWAAGAITFEPRSKGFGKVWKYCLGGGASTLVSGSTYQQVFTPAALTSFTAQLVNILDDGTAGDVDTFAGCKVTGFELSMDNAGVLKLSVDIHGRSVSTATAAATPTVAASRKFAFSGLAASIGTVTAATTTALATATAPLNSLRSFSLKVENSIDTEDFRANGSGKPAEQTRVDLRQITLTTEHAYTSQAQAIRAKWRSRTAEGIVITLTTATALTSGNETLQIVLPSLLVSAPTKPNMDGQRPRATVDYRATLPSSGAALQIVSRTSDTAL